MAALRWRAPMALTLFAVFTLVFSLQQAPVLSAKDKSDSGTAVSSADDSGAPDGNSTKKKAKAAADTKKKEKSKRGKQAADDSVAPSSATSYSNPTGSGIATTGIGGQSSGAASNATPGNVAGNTAGNTNASTSNQTPAPNARTAGTAVRNPTTAGRTNGGKKAGVKSKGRRSNVLDRNNPLVKHVIQVQNRNHASLAAQKGIVGTGTGLDDDGNIVIRVYTTGADNPTIPSMIEDVPTLEVLTGPLFPAQGPASNGDRKFQQPVPIGASIYFFNNCTGTSGLAAGSIGCRLVDNAKNHYILSSNHVLCGDAVIYPSVLNPAAAGGLSTGIGWPPTTGGLTGNASANAPTNQSGLLVTTIASLPVNGVVPPVPAVGVSITQPALIDRGCPLPAPAGDTIGTLFAFIPFNDQTVPTTPNPQTNINGVTTTFLPFPQPPLNQVDCAIALINQNAVDTGTPPDGYGVPTSNLTLATLGMAVQKYGRTTGQTFGTVMGINVATGPTVSINLLQNSVIPASVLAQAETALGGGSIFPVNATATVGFTNEVEIVPASPSANFALTGDSGSLVVDMTKNPVALLRGIAGTSVFCGDINEVMIQLQTLAGLPGNTLLTIDSSPSSHFTSGDSKFGRAGSASTD